MKNLKSNFSYKESLILLSCFAFLYTIFLLLDFGFFSRYIYVYPIKAVLNNSYHFFFAPFILIMGGIKNLKEYTLFSFLSIFFSSILLILTVLYIYIYIKYKKLKYLILFNINILIWLIIGEILFSLKRAF